MLRLKTAQLVDTAGTTRANDGSRRSGPDQRYEERSYLVKGMSSRQCPPALIHDIEGLPGVWKVEVDLDAERLVVRSEGVSDGLVRASIVASGHEVV